MNDGAHIIILASNHRDIGHACSVNIRMGGCRW